MAFAAMFVTAVCETSKFAKQHSHYGTVSFTAPTLGVTLALLQRAVLDAAFMVCLLLSQHSRGLMR